MAVTQVIHTTSDGVGAPKDPRTATAAPGANAPNAPKATVQRDSKGRVVLPSKSAEKTPETEANARNEAHSARVLAATGAWYDARRAMNENPNDGTVAAFTAAEDKLATEIDTREP